MTAVSRTLLFFVVPFVTAQSPPPSSPPVAEVNGIPTWEIALAVGSGTLALLLFAYAIYIIVRRNQEASKDESENMEMGTSTKQDSVPKPAPKPPAAPKPAAVPAPKPAPKPAPPTAPVRQIPPPAPKPKLVEPVEPVVKKVAAPIAINPIPKKAGAVPPPQPVMSTATSSRPIEIKRPDVTRAEVPVSLTSKVSTTVKDVVTDRRGSAPGRIGQTYNDKKKKIPGSNKASAQTSTRASVAIMQERRIVNRGSSGAMGDDAPGSAATRVGRRI